LDPFEADEWVVGLHHFILPSFCFNLIFLSRCNAIYLANIVSQQRP